MNKDAYGDIIMEISKKLAEKILLEEGNLTGRVKTIDGDIAMFLRDVGLHTSEIVLQKSCKGENHHGRGSTKISR